MNYTLVPTTRALSGDVLAKSLLLRRDAAVDPLYEEARRQLEAVLPQTIPFADIDLDPSAHWLPPHYLSDFVLAEFGLTAHVIYSPINACWSVTPAKPYDAGKSYKNTTVHGFSYESWNSEGSLKKYQVTGLELLEMAANLKQPKIKRRKGPLSDATLDNAATTEVVVKQQRLVQAFAEWIARDPERVRQVEEIYNRKFNGFRPMEYNGAHLSFPGMSDLWRSRIRNYQANAIAHGLMTSLLVGHEVGLGKTLVAIATIMERRRLQLSRRPCLVLKKSTLGQIAQTFRETYPDARLLVAEPDDVETGKREMFAAQIAVGDYDCVLITHEMFGRWRMSEKLRRDYVQREIDRHTEAIDAVKPAPNAPKAKSKTTTMKNLERHRRSLQVKLDTWLNDGDEGFTFEELGLDYICLDEGDEFLALPMQTKTQGVLGLNLSESDRALDLAMKVDYLRHTVGKNCLMVLTGTLISNGLHQIYVWQRLIQPDVLESMGIACLDAWLAMFARTKTRAEMRATGRFEIVTRLTEFVNLPELMGAFLLNANIKRYSQVHEYSNIDRPTPVSESVVCAMSPAQYEWMDDIVERAELVRRRNPRKYSRPDPDNPIQVIKTEDNLLWISTDARKACLDMRTIDRNSPFNPESKVEKSAQRIYGFYLEYDSTKGTQLVFCDLSSPSNKYWSYYRAARDRLVDLGIPREEIAFIQDYKNPEDRIALYEAVNEGRIRVLFGATTSMGVGVNVQQRLIALHNIDCPWRPRDLEQRCGRGMRSGNMHGTIHVLNYVTQGSLSNTGFDAYMWQLVEAKGLSIEQFMRMDRTMRRLAESDEDAPVFSPALIKALATGDDRILRQVELTAAVEQLVAMQRSYTRDLRLLTDGGYYSKQEVIRQIDRIELPAQDLEVAVMARALLTQIRSDEPPEMVLGKETEFPNILKFCKAMIAVEPPDNVPGAITLKKGSIGPFSLAVQFQNVPAIIEGKATHRLERDWFLIDRFNQYHHVRAMKQPDTQLGQVTGSLEALARAPQIAENRMAGLRQRLTEMEAEEASKRAHLEEVSDRLAITRADLASIEAELGFGDDQPESVTSVDAD
jgi:N12 class adenine-specific DNA methylase